ncbi:MAG: phospholipase D family protein [Duodenibacillus sp.]|nr:phospholipase D family protein [Duodenibacillus sp.]
MIRRALGLAAAFSLAALAAGAAQAAPACDGCGPYEASARVYFSPNGGAQDALVREIGGAQKSVRVLAYHFSNKAVARALVEAQERGVDVKVVVDAETGRKSKSLVPWIVKRGVPVWLDGSHGSAHNKVMIIDKRVVVTGSYNFNEHAETVNADNMLIIDSKPLARRYHEQWKLHKEHAGKP